MENQFPSDYIDLYDHMILCRHKLKMCLHYIGEECGRLGKKDDPAGRREAAMWIYMLHEIALETVESMLRAGESPAGSPD